MVSYRPAGLEFDAESTLPLEDSVRLVTNLWQYLEPGDSAEFPRIDDELLLDALAVQFIAFTGEIDEEEHLSEKQRKLDWTAWIAENSPNSDLSELNQQRLKNMQPQDVRDNSQLLKHAKTDALHAVSWIESTEGVLSRALMLCRFATGAGIALINSANVGDEFTETWINSLALGRGISSGPQDEENAKDLWSDVELAIEEVSRLKTSNRYSLLDKVGEYILSLSLMERVTVWSFAK